MQDERPQLQTVGRVRGAWWTVSLLSTLYVLSFVDRVILALLVTPLKADLNVSDVQLGLLFGPAFAIFYAVLGLPIARLADRGNRKRLIVCGVLTWAAATIASAYAGAFWVLVSFRIGLAVGEAALTPSAHSMIGDLFTPRRRGLAASLYSAAGMAGASGAYILGAAVVHEVGHLNASGIAPSFNTWRLVLVAVGVPSLLVGLVFAATTREPRRLRTTASAPGAREAFRYLARRRRLFGGLFLGAGLTQAIGYAYAAWGPEFIHRRFSWPIPQAGLAFGLAGLAAGFGGTLLMPIITQNLFRSGQSRAVALTSMAAVAVGGGLAALAPLQGDPMMFLLLFAGASFCLTGASNNVLVALQVMAPERMRATFVALLLMCITLLGLGIGPSVTALISSRLDPGGGGLAVALALLSPLVAVPAFLLMLWSLRGGEADSEIEASDGAAAVKLTTTSQTMASLDRPYKLADRRFPL
jgi:MFS family permease